MKRMTAPLLLGALALSVLIQLPMSIAARSDGYDFIDPIINVRRILLDRFVTEPDETAMRTAMLKAMAESVNDPYTIYVPPSDEDDFNKNLHGTYVGIGAEVNIVNEELTIITPMEDSPAREAGVRSGDVVVEIEGEPTRGLSVAECIDRLVGIPGTSVTVLVRHTDGSTQELTIERRQIVTRTVKGVLRDNENWKYCIDPELGLAYVRITQFQSNTVTELRQTLDDMQRSGGLNGLILDLRDNPGGALPAAIEMSDLFLDRGTIVTIRGRHPGEVREFGAQAPGTLQRFPIAVLINGRSASASEIVAGALQDNNRAVVIGSRTFGKGSVQQVRELEHNRGTLKFTSAHYYLPSGRNINQHPESGTWGVDPNAGMIIPFPDEDYFRMLEKRREFEVIREGVDIADCVDRQWVEESLGDIQLLAAIDALHANARGEGWPQLSNEDPELVALNQRINDGLEQRAMLIREVQRLEQQLRTLQGFASAEGRQDLIPDDVDAEGATITLHDKLGNELGTYRVMAGDLEMALDTLQVVPVEDED